VSVVSQQYGSIVQELHDEPHIEDSRTTVRFVHRRVEKGDLSPTEFADRYDLDLADVYRALAYYHDHSEEMAAVESHRRETIEAHREKAVTGPGDVNGSPDSGS